MEKSGCLAPLVREKVSPGRKIGDYKLICYYYIAISQTTLPEGFDMDIAPTDGLH